MADVQAAWIAASASIAVSLVSLAGTFWTAQRSRELAREQARVGENLARLNSSLSAENDAAKAKRDYEYEARKRLYAELYPLAFHLHEAAFGAVNRIKNLALAARKGYLAEGADNWISGTDPYYFNSVIHSLVAPLAIYELMTRRLTFLDLRLDQHLYRQHFLASRAYRAFRSDFDLADPSRCPAIAFPDAPEEGYKPPEIRPQVPLTDLEQRRMWRQGLYSGQVSQAVDALMLTDGTDGAGRARYRVMTYAEFAKALGANDLRTPDAGEGGGGEMKTALRPISDLFLDFHPARRPVTWRILMAQTACYRALIAAARDPDLETSKILRQALFARSEDRADFDWLGDGTRAIPPALRHGTDFAAERDSSLSVADSYLKTAIEDLDRHSVAR